MKITYMEANCYKYTFDDPKIRAWVTDRCEGDVLNLFAGQNIVSPREVRVDVDANMPKLHYKMSAEKYLDEMCWDFDTIIYDPPWNERKAKELYNGNYIGKFTKLKNQIVGNLNYNGKIISAGYEITNFGEKRGLQLEELLIVNPKGEIRPFFVSIERRLPSLEEYE